LPPLLRQEVRGYQGLLALSAILYPAFGFLVPVLEQGTVDPIWLRCLGVLPAMGVLLYSLFSSRGQQLLAQAAELTSWLCAIHFSVLLYLNHLSTIYFVSMLIVVSAGTLSAPSMRRVGAFVILCMIGSIAAAVLADEPKIQPWFVVVMVNAQAGLVFSAVSGRLRAFQEVQKGRVELERMARYDALTGLCNRTLFLETLPKALARTSRVDRSLALLYIDLDHFKSVNDAHGHGCGDHLLQAVAERLQKTVRTGDLVARLGGDEFTMILENVNASSEVAAVARKLLRALSTPFRLPEATVKISASIGIIMIKGGQARNPGDLVRVADQAMYLAKNAGRNTFRLEVAEVPKESYERAAPTSAG
jgi:diguanylate cyclase (GGDEF)-like protein